MGLPLSSARAPVPNSLIRLTAIALLSVCSGIVAAQSAPASAVEPPTLRLPAGAHPTRYALTLTIVPGEPKAHGEIAIDVELDRPHTVLWLNADSLDVTRADVESGEARVSLLSGHEQFVGLAFDPALAAGMHRVKLVFEAEQSRNSTRGIFTLEDGGAWYTMTQFEALSARRAFPCFDEPGFKTPWQLTLRVPRGLVAVSNTRVESETSSDDGFQTVRFAETRPLPSYLVAFAVGSWEIIDLGNVGAKPTPTRIIVPRGRTADAEFVKSAYPELFARVESYFGTAYPFEKLDHITIPITVNFAMENAGLITYGAPGLLAKPGAATPRFQRGAANVGTHEISHMWFGDLVTMAWWDDLWLNEAFATWMAEKIVHQWRPDYDRGAARIGERADAIDADALVSARKIREPIVNRGDIFKAFDHITYQKGATVIAMFEGWVGEEPFRSGVRSYIEAHRDASATSADFLAAVEQASRKPVTSAFNTFLNQNGVPQLDVRVQCGKDGAQLALTQHRLDLIGATKGAAQRWQIPVCVRYGAGAVSSHEACTLMTEASTNLPLAGGCPAFVFANAGGRGYYVPDYRDGLLAKLEANREQLSVAEYESFLLDLKALVRAGSVTSAQALRWARFGAAAPDRHVVVAAVDLAEFVGNTTVVDADRPKYSRFVREVFGPRAKALGFKPRASESDDDQLLRRTLLRFVAPEDPALAAEARRLAHAWIRDKSAIDPGMVDVVLVTAGRTGDAATFDALLAEAKATKDRLERRYLMMALFAFSDPVLATKGFSLLLDPTFDVRESWTALGNGFWWNPARRATNDYIMANFDTLARSVGTEEPGRWPIFASGLCTERDRVELEAFWKPRVSNYASASRELASTVESIDLCARVRTANRR